MEWLVEFFKNLFTKKKEPTGIYIEPRDVITAPPVTVPTDSPFKHDQIGVDISHHNHDVDLDVLSDNVDFIYMKATEGRSFVSSALKSRAKELNEIGKVPWGVYHYYKTDVDPLVQAKHFVDHIDVNSGLPPVLDVERINNNDYKYYKHTADLLVILNYIEEKTGITPIIYTNFFFARDKIKPGEEFKRFPLWIAWYTNDFSRVRIPEPWDNALIWQNTEYGRIEGVNGHVDVNKVL